MITVKCEPTYTMPKMIHNTNTKVNSLSWRISKCGYLFIAPCEWDFSLPLNRTRRWQRRWFILYENGKLTYSLDEEPDTVPQGVIDMNNVVEISDAEESTGNQFSIALKTGEKTHFIKGTSKEEKRWWFDVLSKYAKSAAIRETSSRLKRNTSYLGGNLTKSVDQLWENCNGSSKQEKVPQPSRVTRIPSNPLEQRAPLSIELNCRLNTTRNKNDSDYRILPPSPPVNRTISISRLKGKARSRSTSRSRMVSSLPCSGEISFSESSKSTKVPSDSLSVSDDERDSSPVYKKPSQIHRNGLGKSHDSLTCKGINEIVNSIDEVNLDDFINIDPKSLDDQIIDKEWEELVRNNSLNCGVRKSKSVDKLSYEKLSINNNLRQKTQSTLINNNNYFGNIADKNSFNNNNNYNRQINGKIAQINKANSILSNGKSHTPSHHHSHPLLVNGNGHHYPPQHHDSDESLKMSTSPSMSSSPESLASTNGSGTRFKEIVSLYEDLAKSVTDPDRAPKKENEVCRLKSTIMKLENVCQSKLEEIEDVHQKMDQLRQEPQPPPEKNVHHNLSECLRDENAGLHQELEKMRSFILKEESDRYKDESKFKETTNRLKDRLKELNKELRESYINYDYLEMAYSRLKKDLKGVQESHEAELSLMKERLHDLTAKLITSEKNLRQAKAKISKLEARQERRRSLMRDKDYNCMSKDFHNKLQELERKIAGIQIILLANEHQSPDEGLPDIETNSLPISLDGRPILPSQSCVVIQPSSKTTQSDTKTMLQIH
ncbi:uncharacterized protein LOC141854078 isoform X1 [Brevipalpus obovatus]|uniref:uncharacterized protein LOC141854078 isoform X1 n=1 Tax=Brevipalpus obovatus TaxID=246614 RepID=UPI003D9F18E1